jgi:hypothetical protein
MDLENLWQENKRFVLTVAGGVLVFMIGEMIIGQVFGDELNAERRSVASANRDLGEAMFGADDLTRARSENRALRGALQDLAHAAAFSAREQYRIDPAAGSASSQFFGTVSSAREELLTLAGRNDLRVPDAVGLPALSPTRDGDIERHLEALDLIDRVVHACVDAGVERIDSIDIKLDPKLDAREGVGRVERTRVDFTLSGRTAPIQRFLLATQAGDEPLVVQAMELVPSRRSEDEARLEISFTIVRLAAEVHELAGDADGDAVDDGEDEG